eukprot:8659772-Heterocapsa_arctica.AAC.1
MEATKKRPRESTETEEVSDEKEEAVSEQTINEKRLVALDDFEKFVLEEKKDRKKEKKRVAASNRYRPCPTSSSEGAST